MLRQIKKMWFDTTTFEGKYVAKDLMKWVAFLAGLLLLGACAVGDFFGHVIRTEPGWMVLGYSAAIAGVKEFAKYKTNAIAALTDSPPVADNEPPKGELTPDLSKVQ